jgi:ribosome-binding ATPase YchF (GTP1/OBG family)
MKIGLVGYKGSGKSTLFSWLTGVKTDPALSHASQSAMATIPEPRVDALARIYHAKKTTFAALEIVDTPGLSRSHEGSAARLAAIREAGCLILVAAAFDGSNPAADAKSFSEDLLLADMEIVGNRIGRIAEAVKKPIPRQEREHLQHEEQTLKLVLAAMESGRPLRPEDMSDEQRKVTRPFCLMTEKPWMAIINTADDEKNPERFLQAMSEGVRALAIPVGLEWELARMSPEDRAEFERELGVGATDRGQVIRTILEASGQMLYLTVSEKEARSWIMRRGGTALEAAATIHTDLARGFIRAEVMKCQDLVRLGSEREVKAQHLMRQEPKDYVVQDDDVILIRFSV